MGSSTRLLHDLFVDVPTRICVALLLSLVLAHPNDLHADDSDKSSSWTTRSGYYIISYKAEIDPLTINRIHRWVFHIEDAAGMAIDEAIISLTGGMPEHNHGLPTSPRMTDALGGGDYIVEGMRFHMSGYWELYVTIDVDGRRDTVVIPLTI